MNQPDANDLETWLEDLLSAQADALIADKPFTPDIDRFNRPVRQTALTNDLLELGRSLREALTPTSPTPEFVARLKNELIGKEPVTLLVRWRKLPANYQLAAKLGGLTITAGIMLLAARQGLNVLETLQHRNQPKSDSNLSLNSAG